VVGVTFQRERACFSHLWPDAPALFDGLLFEACLTRNKLGNSGQVAKCAAVSEVVNGPERERTQWNELERANESARCTSKSKSATPVFNQNGSRIVPTHRLNPTSRRSREPRQAKQSQA